MNLEIHIMKKRDKLLRSYKTLWERSKRNEARLARIKKIYLGEIKPAHRKLSFILRHLKDNNK